MNVANFLARLPLFRGLPPHELSELSKITSLRSFRQGETVFVEGEPASGFYILFSGKVKIFKLSREGKEQILHIIEPGDSFAEITVFEAGSTRRMPRRWNRAGRCLFRPQPSSGNSRATRIWR